MRRKTFIGRDMVHPRARWIRRLLHKRATMTQDRREQLARTWMTRAASKLYGPTGESIYGSAFDLAVDCVYDLSLVSPAGVGYDRDGTPWPGDWEIPQYAVDIAESIMGPDSGEAS